MAKAVPKTPVMSTKVQFAKVAVVVAAVHMVQMVSEYMYYSYCSRNIFRSLFTRGSPMCQMLRSTSDTLSISFNKIVAGSLLVALQHPLNKFLEGGSGAPAESGLSV